MGRSVGIMRGVLGVPRFEGRERVSEWDGIEGKEMRGPARAGRVPFVPKTAVMARARVVLRLNMVFLQ